jgi:hypothetical protein
MRIHNLNICGNLQDGIKGSIVYLFLYSRLLEFLQFSDQTFQFGTATCAVEYVSRDAPYTGTGFAGYPANPKAGYRISGRILGLQFFFLPYLKKSK